MKRFQLKTGEGFLQAAWKCHKTLQSTIKCQAIRWPNTRAYTVVKTVNKMSIPISLYVGAGIKYIREYLTSQFYYAW